MLLNIWALFENRTLTATLIRSSPGEWQTTKTKQSKKNTIKHSPHNKQTTHQTQVYNGQTMARSLPQGSRQIDCDVLGKHTWSRWQSNLLLWDTECPSHVFSPCDPLCHLSLSLHMSGWFPPIMVSQYWEQLVITVCRVLPSCAILPHKNTHTHTHTHTLSCMCTHTHTHTHTHTQRRTHTNTHIDRSFL